MNWIQKQAKEAVKRAESKWGGAWRLLSDEQRQGAIAQEVVTLLVAQDENQCSPLLLKLQQVALTAMGEENSA